MNDTLTQYLIEHNCSEGYSRYDEDYAEECTLNEVANSIMGWIGIAVVIIQICYGLLLLFAELKDLIETKKNEKKKKNMKIRLYLFLLGISDGVTVFISIWLNLHHIMMYESLFAAIIRSLHFIVLFGLMNGLIYFMIVLNKKMKLIQRKIKKLMRIMKWTMIIYTIIVDVYFVTAVPICHYYPLWCTKLLWSGVAIFGIISMSTYIFMNWRIVQILKDDPYQEDVDKTSISYQSSVKMQNQFKSRLRLFIILFPPITIIDIGSMLIIMLNIPGVSYILVGMILISDSPFVMMIYYILMSKAKVKNLFGYSTSSTSTESGNSGSQVNTTSSKNNMKSHKSTGEAS